MKRNLTILFTFFSLFSCNSKQHEIPETTKVSEIKKKANLSIDSFLLRETFNQVDNPSNEFLTTSLKPIRQNFKRINSISSKDWSSVVTKDLESTNEGGDVTYYYLNKNLEKIVIKEFGETFQVLTEFYLLDKTISFVFEKSLKYNRPIYQDSSAMKQINDDQVFNIDKSEVIEERSYFEKRKLINQLNNQDCGSPFTDDYLKDEQIRIVNKYNRILKLEESK